MPHRGLLRHGALMQPGDLGAPIPDTRGRLLCAVGADEHGERLVRVTRRLASVTGLRPLFAHVVPPADADGTGTWRARSLLRHAGAHGSEMCVEVGDPATALLRCAKDEGASLLIVAARGFGPLKAALLGSVSRALMTRAPIPVMILPPSAEPAFDGERVLCAITSDGSAGTSRAVAGDLAGLRGRELTLVEVGGSRSHADADADADAVASLEALASAADADLVVLPGSSCSSGLLDEELGVRFANSASTPVVVVPSSASGARPAA